MQLRLRAIVMLFFGLCLILLWSVRINSCASFQFSWLGIMPMQVLPFPPVWTFACTKLVPLDAQALSLQNFLDCIHCAPGSCTWYRLVFRWCTSTGCPGVLILGNTTLASVHLSSHLRSHMVSTIACLSISAFTDLVQCKTWLVVFTCAIGY